MNRRKQSKRRDGIRFCAERRQRLLERYILHRNALAPGRRLSNFWLLGFFDRRVKAAPGERHARKRQSLSDPGSVSEKPNPDPLVSFASFCSKLFVLPPSAVTRAKGNLLNDPVAPPKTQSRPPSFPLLPSVQILFVCFRVP